MCVCVNLSARVCVCVSLSARVCVCESLCEGVRVHREQTSTRRIEKP